MKNINTKISVFSFKSSRFLALFCLLLSAFSLQPSDSFAQKKQKIDVQVKVFTKNFIVDAKEKLEVNTKYTKIVFQEWEKNQIDFTTTITLKNATEEDMVQLLGFLNIDNFQAGKKVSYKLLLNYIITNGKGKYTNDRKMCDIRNNMEIDLLIKIPKDIFINVSSKYGNVEIGNVHLDFIANLNYSNLNIDHLFGSENNIEMRYGNLFVDDISGNNNSIYMRYGNINMGNMTGKSNTIDIHYGKMKIKQVNILTLSARYSSQCEINDIGVLKLDSRYCTFIFNNVKSISGSSGYDKISIQNSIEKIEGDFKYGTVTVGTLKQSCVLQPFSYSKISVDEVLSSFKNIDIEASYSQIKLNIPQEQSFKLNYSGRYTDFKDQSIKLNEASFEAGSNSVKMSGIYGKNADSGKKVKIDARYGSVSLFGR